MDADDDSTARQKANRHHRALAPGRRPPPRPVKIPFTTLPALKLPPPPGPKLSSATTAPATPAPSKPNVGEMKANQDKPSPPKLSSAATAPEAPTQDKKSSPKGK